MPYRVYIQEVVVTIGKVHKRRLSKAERHHKLMEQGLRNKAEQRAQRTIARQRRSQKREQAAKESRRRNHVN